MFGEDKMTGKKFDNTLELSIETKPIPIMDRGNVNRPMLTGITGIDMIYPVGCGQRQLIIGDKKTGKTQIALDTIANQKDRNMLCIYIAVGKTKKEVKEVYMELLRRDAMKYTVIMSAFNDECPPVLRNTPFVGLSVAEHYMLENRMDVLVVIDDLKKHADIYREISLLTGKVPGRDAYPSDIFFTHASMLEKGCQHKNGGSITVLPIVETKGGDITDYISKNIISITDGQIVLSAKNFEKGQKPAIDYGLSVSRLGGAVQTKQMKKIGAAVRRELLSYLEKCDVYELANMDEMSPELRSKMINGKEIRRRLNQYKFNPRTQEEMSVLFDGLVDFD
jgi:F-type H+-transporting ATPase subunit alpha